MADRDPQTQYQIGDHVLYKPAGIYTRIKGYVWREAVSSPPAVLAYQLECGCQAPDALISRCDAPKSTVEVSQATLDELLRENLEIRKLVAEASVPAPLGKVVG